MSRTARLDRPLAASAALFFLGLLVGGALSRTATPVPVPSVGERSAWFFLSRNATVAAILYAGSVTFGVATAVTLCYNGFIIGYAVAASERVIRSVMLVAPHGVFELPAFVLAGAAGLGLPAEVVQYLTGTQETLLRRSAVVESLERFLLALALLVVAAWVESAVTPAVAAAV
ncbi:stage II sporulation protein M [Halosimplex rubrum]|uniref:Stage II sporulation protein M n=1 Tax=Halosimplex rubrum TaxID=869889 RepID=A0A7D5P5C8_9EURY|nr:stage II sporulation protein M [Halosimplex rubrum]QLH79481.1 stage II sporulation protein M [Halosimplex rubrum]